MSWLDETKIPRTNHVWYTNHHYWDKDYFEIFKHKLSKFKKGDDVLIRIQDEIIRDEYTFKKIIELIEKSESNVKLSMSTIDEFEHSTHPYTNIHWWKDSNMRKTISWHDGYGTMPHFIFNKDCLKIESKSIRGILSVRKITPERYVLFEKEIKLDNGIVRFARWESDSTQEEQQDWQNFPNVYELREEYKKSYFAFVVETDTIDTHRNQISEKTLLSFVSGCIPIVYGQYEYVKKLQKIGFYIFNDKFDSWCDYPYYRKRQDSFTDVIKEINDLSMDDIRKYWISNKDKIEHNYNLLKTISRSSNNLI